MNISAEEQTCLCGQTLSFESSAQVNLFNTKSTQKVDDLQKGVSTKNAQLDTPIKLNYQKTQNWYALRTTYGREKKAYDYIMSHGGTAFYPTITEEKLVNGKKRLFTVSRLPNLLFAYGTKEEIQSFVYDNVNLPFLRFYYKHIHERTKIKREPLIVPERQIKSLQIICQFEAGDIVVVSQTIDKFQTGDWVRITNGNFKGVEGIVARYQGQQRVGIVIEGLFTVATAYVPTAFLEKTEKH